MRDIHVIYTDFTHLGQGWDLSCPQIPTLVGGDMSLRRLLDETPNILEFAGVEGPYNLIQHEQKYAETPDGLGFYLRFLGLDDPHEDDRVAVIGRQLHAVCSGEIIDELDRIPPLPSGERLIIAVHKSDRLGWVLDQMGDGEGCIACSYEGDDAIYSLPVAHDDCDYGRGRTLDELGLTRDSSIGDAFDTVLASEVADLVKVLDRSDLPATADVHGLLHYR